MAGEPRVLVCVTTYTEESAIGKPGDIEVEVLLANPDGRRLAKDFQSYDGKNGENHDVFETPIQCTWTDHYPVDGNEVRELEGFNQRGGHLDKSGDLLTWLVEKTSPNEVWRILFTARKIAEAHPEWHIDDCVRVSMMWERG